MTKTKPQLWNARIIGQAIADSFGKLDPRVQLRNPVMFSVFLGSILTTILWLKSLAAASHESSGFILGITVWLWFTVLFANFAEAIAEGHGKAQAATLKKSRTTTIAHKLSGERDRAGQEVAATDLKLGDRVIVKAGEMIPADGEVVEGVASVD
ncbi:MAG: P-type ATPase, partial [Aureliella sp.]